MFLTYRFHMCMGDLLLWRQDAAIQVGFADRYIRVEFSNGRNFAALVSPCNHVQGAMYARGQNVSHIVDATDLLTAVPFHPRGDMLHVLLPSVMSV